MIKFIDRFIIYSSIAILVYFCLFCISIFFLGFYELYIFMENHSLLKFYVVLSFKIFLTIGGLLAFLLILDIYYRRKKYGLRG